jgi:ketosteroid isomerase-like protein
MTGQMVTIDETTTLSTVERFNNALNRGDIDEVTALMTDDCVFESTWPAPDGERYEGRDSIRRFWERLIETPGLRFDAEELIVAGDRATVRWRYWWREADGTSGTVRGVDIFRVRGGRVAEKLSYVKG